MENAAVLVIDDKVFDISGCVQTVAAHDKETGNLKYRGNGIVIFRSNHVQGNLVTFINYVGEKMIFGKWVKVYNKSSWSDSSYLEFDMVADHSNLVIEGCNLPGLISHSR